MLVEILPSWIRSEYENDIWKETSRDASPVNEVLGVETVVPLNGGTFIRKLTHASMCEFESSLEPAKLSSCRKIGVAISLNGATAGYVPVNSIRRKYALTNEFDVRQRFGNCAIKSSRVCSGYGSKVTSLRGASSRHSTSLDV
jgi:hypothetical protein